MRNTIRNALLAVATVIVVAGGIFYFVTSAPKQTPAIAPVAQQDQPLGRFEKGNGQNFAADREELTSPQWRPEGMTVSSNEILAPDGTSKTFLLDETATSGAHRVETTPTTIKPGMNTLSLYVKPRGRRYFQFEMRDSKPGKYGVARFDLQRKTVVAQSGDVATSGVEELPDGWYRCWAAMRYASDAAVFDFGLVNDHVATDYAGTPGSGMLVWGVQVESGGKPTAYTPTTMAR